MGLASRMAAMNAAPGAGYPSAPGSAPAPYGAPPPGYGAPPGAPPQQYGAPPGVPPQQYGAPPGAPPQQYGAPPGAPPQQYGAPPAGYGAPAPSPYAQASATASKYPAAPGQAPPGGYPSAPGGYPGAPGAPGGYAPSGGAPGGYPGAPGGAPGAYQPSSGAPGGYPQPGGSPGGAPGGYAPQGGAPGAPPMAGPPAAHTERYRQAIYQRLVSVIQRNGISAFYPQAQLDGVLSKAMSVDYDALAQRWRLPNVELALDLASLALYDMVLLCDDSGSMAYEQDGSRIDDLKAVVEKVAEVVTLFDDDGAVVRFLNSAVRGEGVRTSAQATQLVSQVKFSGSTPIGERLESLVLQPIVYSQTLRKPVLVITITDGVPDSQEAVLRAMMGCKQRMSGTPFGPRAVAFEFAQVGNDMAAMKWLATLDNNPQIGDIVDVTSNYEAEEMEWKRKNPGNELTPGLWLLKLLLGAIDPQYDDKD